MHSENSDCLMCLKLSTCSFSIRYHICCSLPLEFAKTVNNVFHNIHHCSVGCTSWLQPFLSLLLISRKPVVFTLVEMPVAWPLMSVSHVMNDRQPLLFQDFWIITTAFCTPPQLVDYSWDPWCQVRTS